MSTPPARPRAALLLLSYLAFVSLGLPDGLLGVSWPSIRGDFDVPTEAVGWVLTAGTVGYLTSSVLAGFTLARVGVGALLAGSTLLASLALTGYSVSPVLAVLVGCALLLGLGSGAVDSGLNAYAAGAFGPRHMNWLHAFFGLGVAIGPLIMTAVLSAGLAWRWGYGIVAAAQLVLAAAFALTVRAWHRGAPASTEADAPVPTEAGAAIQAGPTSAVRVPVRATLRLPAVWSGTLAFVLYVAIEVSAGLWAFLLLTEGRGLSAALAGGCVSAYWGSLFIGRVVQGLVAERLGAGLVLRVSLAGMAVGAALIAVPGPALLAVLGLVVVGFAAAPVFPLLTLTTAERVGAAHADRAIGLQIGAAGVGAALVPAGLGVLIGNTSVQVLGSALLVLALALIALYEWGDRRSTGRPTGQPAPTQPGREGQPASGPVRPVVDGR
ncbi:3-(3-hydroxy-phenyl)propionate transporter [Micromonospora noduli]|uniref:3-(3-hydroxy-phenyl)propionate transporter n=1 Tax=Micromonospora noduli TaxID=709876 RepID=A0A328N6F8_9ACTN|nr:MFS transporter [Micromonospora noduli]KAB1917077.1 MFS transporter [Micromonospora noduli]RAO03582.1 3-(3-hydroxy-phenyl)propionate transporter [Micromonospora noduli]RAO10969.1 3-(3-hydroxy-phenyl)propionate transporter [Micromonospora noduli]RAO11934.1 3-(3-hydroxy-phenyl)propionate transporter [Micromonospora noduli]RAO33140.1 3-(3-hydroxy-phenyl)propionate transporter [Micromonospora noduli]